MLVYRVETPSGVGPFTNRYKAMTDPAPDDSYCNDCWNFGMLMGNHLKDDMHPVPDRRFIEHGYNFGCNSIESLSTWFNAPMLAILAKYGYVVKVFNVKRPAKVSPGQVAFKMKNALLIETHPLTILA
jgi:hypothetical protein